VTQQIEDLYRPKVRRRRFPPSRRTSLIVIVILLASGLLWVGSLWFQTCGGFGTGVSKVDGQCVGVTDGSYVFEPNLADVEGKIKKANDNIGQAKSVTVAVLNMFTANDTSPLTPDEIREQLEGAYVAQQAANNGVNFGDKNLKIRLVIANEGSDEQQWQPTVQQLIGMKQDSSPLVTVVGLGVSIPATVDSGRALADAGLPMVGAVLTAVDGTKVPGLFRVQPSDREFVTGLDLYLKQHPDLNQGLIVYDSNSGTNGTAVQDLYTQSLFDSDQHQLNRVLRYNPLGFQGKSVPSHSDADMFDRLVTTICGVAPNIVLYAGRLVDLTDFLTALEGRECAPKGPITVLTGGTDLGVLNTATIRQQLTKGRISVVYSSPTDVADWRTYPASAPRHFAQFLDEYEAEHVPMADLDDGYAVSMYDAVATATEAIRHAYNGGALPSPTDVLHQLPNLVNTDTVPAAGGDLSFAVQNHGDPGGKPLPVLRIPADPAVTAPPIANCAATQPGYAYCTPR
jgi:hypothetical protein